MKRVFSALFVVVLISACASQHAVVASTPRSIMIAGTAFTDADRQKAFSLAQTECEKHKRNAVLSREIGSKIKAEWTFDCVL